MHFSVDLVAQAEQKFFHQKKKVPNYEMLFYGLTSYLAVPYNFKTCFLRAIRVSHVWMDRN